MGDSYKSGRRYSKFEDKTIRDMLEEGRSSLEVAKVLERPVGGIEKRISKFKLHKTTNRAAGNVRFDEITKIVDLYLSGKRIEAIANETRRSDRSVKRVTFVVDYVKKKIKEEKKITIATKEPDWVSSPTMISAKAICEMTNKININNNIDHLNKVNALIFDAARQGKYSVALEEPLTNSEYELFGKMGYQYNERWDSTVNKFRYWIRWDVK